MANALPTTSEGKAQLFYVAYYGRPADPLGLAYWTSVIDAAGGDLAAVSNNFGNSEEANAVYGGLSTAAAVNKLYNQMFNRDAEPAGLAFWVGEINAGNVKLSDLPLALYVGAQGTDAEAFANKLEVANAFTAALDTTAEILAYNGIAAMAGAVDLLATVDQTPESVEAATAQIDDVIADIGAAPDQTLVLTTDIDNLVGGAGFDRFLGGTTTLGLGDSIDGGAGNDELELTLAGNGGEAGDGLYAGFLVDNVETINLRSIGFADGSGSDGVRVEFTGVTGLQTLNIFRSTNITEARDIQNIIDVNLNDVADDVVIDFDAQAVLASDDTLDLSVREVGASAEGEDAVTIDEGIEILNIDDRGADAFESNFSLYAYGLDEINITGGDDYTQTAGVQQNHLALEWVQTGGGTTLDSTQYAGDLYVATEQQSVDQIATGVGDDVVEIDSDWDFGQTISTGDGADFVGVYGDGEDGVTLGGTIDTGNGNDEVEVWNGYYSDWAVGETGLITTGDGDDEVYLYGGIAPDGVDADDVAGTVLLGNGNDFLEVYGGDLAGLVEAGAGDDYVEVDNGQLADTGVVNGDEGDDELALWNSFNGGGQVVTADATVTGVETLTLGNYDDDDGDVDHDIDLDAFDEALATIDIVNDAYTFGEDADHEVHLTNLTTEAIKITSVDSDAGDDVELEVTLKDGSGDDDSLSVTLYGGTELAPAKFEVDIQDEGAAGNEIENLALVNDGVGAREVDTSQDFDKSLTVTGNSTSNLRVFNSTSQLVDASAYAGDFTIEVATEQDYEILTGSGDDTIDLLLDVFTMDDTVDGGAGTDRLIVNESTQDPARPDSDEAFNNVSNVEELEVRGEDEGTFYVSLDDDAYAAGIERLIVEDDEGEQANVELIVGPDFERGLRIDHNNGALNVDNDGAVDLDIYLDAEGGRTLTFTDASNGGDVNLTVTINDNGDDTFIDSAQAGAGTDGSIQLAVTAGSIDKIVLLDNLAHGSAGDNGTVEIVTDDSWTDGSSTVGTLTVDASAIADDDLNTFTGGVILDAALETDAKIVFTGSANDDEAYGGALDDTLVLGAGDDYAEGGLGADSISGEAGNDILWGDEGNDTIDGGAGDDDITGGLGKDVLTGGAGNDIFYFDDALESNGLNIDVITDFNVGDDTISIFEDLLASAYFAGDAGVDGIPGNGDDNPATGLVYLGEVEGYGAVLTALTAGSGDSQAVLDKLDSRLYIDLNNDGILNDLDLVITLTGVTDLSQADFTAHGAPV